MTKAEKVKANEYDQLESMNKFSQHSDIMSSTELPDLRQKLPKKSSKPLAAEFLDDEAESHYSSSYCTLDDDANSQDSIRTVTVSSGEEIKASADEEAYQEYKRVYDRLLEDDDEDN